jgi:hypothetical protein
MQEIGHPPPTQLLEGHCQMQRFPLTGTWPAKRLEGGTELLQIKGNDSIQQYRHEKM